MIFICYDYNLLKDFKNILMHYIKQQVYYFTKLKSYIIIILIMKGVFKNEEMALQDLRLRV